MEDSEKLFSEFPPVTTEQWDNIIIKDLKGADYQKKLMWKTDDGFTVRPYYRAEDLDDLSYLDSLPSEFPYTRGYRCEDNDWKIVQEISETDPAKANEIAVSSLAKGANTIAFSVKEIKTAADINVLLKNIDLEKAGLQFNNSAAYIPFVQLFLDFIENNNVDKTKINVSIQFDPISYLLKHNTFFNSREQDLNELLQLLDLTKDCPNFKVLNINGLLIHNAGSTIVQELGYSLGIANEYLAFCMEKGKSVTLLASKMQFTLSVGSNYFMEIAKLRAVRLLWSTIVQEYHPTCDCAYHLQINSVASTWNKTLYDPYINMLRSTTEGMAAAIGGADSISLKPFDVAYKNDDEFSRRISRNVQVILKEESYFGKVVDPAAGSYYLENLTNSISEQAWLLFQHTEAEGGMIKLIENQEVKNEIEKCCQKRDLDIATRKYILLGTNQYPNINEQVIDKIEIRKKDEAKGLQTYRGAEAFEELRLATEKFTKLHSRPKVFLLKVGNIAMRQARAGFITNFFGCAGYEILDNSGFATVAEGVEEAKKANPAIVVICSSDEEYATLGVEAAQLIKKELKNSYFLVAGNPIEAIDSLKAAGVFDFIHVRLNVLDTINKYNTLILK